MDTDRDVAIGDALRALTEADDTGVTWHAIFPDGEISSHRPDAPVEIGSCFKACVAAECCRQVEEGELRWEDVLEILPEIRVPSSEATESLPDGSAITLDAAARAMIRVSDNTATDLVLEKVGHARVQHFVNHMGLLATRIPESVAKVYAAEARAGMAEACISTTRDLAHFYVSSVPGDLFRTDGAHQRFLSIMREEDRHQGTNWPNGAVCYRKGGSMVTDAVVAQALGCAFEKDSQRAYVALAAYTSPPGEEDLAAFFENVSICFGNALNVVLAGMIQG